MGHSDHLPTTGFPVDELVERYPRLYHMAELGSWPSIREHGLLSTSALLDLYEVAGRLRSSIEDAHRPESIRITHDRMGIAVVRDQKPMSESKLAASLRGGLTPRDWYRLLNERVFFWLTEERLNTLLAARAYRDREHTVLTVDSASLLSRHAEQVFLAAMNTGNTQPFAHPRGRSTFQPLATYPLASRLRRGLEPAVELAVMRGVPDIEAHTIQVRTIRAGREPKVIWP